MSSIEMGLSLDCDIETEGMLLINKALVQNEEGNSTAAKKTLLGVVFDQASTLGNIEMAKFVLGTLE